MTINVDKTAQINFGAFAAADDAGTVVVHPHSGHDGTNVDRLSIGPSAARFTVSGGRERPFSMTLSEPGKIVLDSREALSANSTAESCLGAHLDSRAELSARRLYRLLQRDR